MVAPDPPLTADGVVLRVPDAGDATWITTACNDADIARFVVGIPSPYTQADAEWFLDRAKSRWASGLAVEFVIEDASRVEPLGLLSLSLGDQDPARASIGYWLRPEARGRGAATVAVQLVARWAFDKLGVQRLELTTAPGNLASQRVAERAGFTGEGVLRAFVATKDGGRRDSVMFSLLPADLS